MCFVLHCKLTINRRYNMNNYTESWIANLDGDMLDFLAGHLTHGKTYEVLEDYNGSVYSDQCHVVLNDNGGDDRIPPFMVHPS